MLRNRRGGAFIAKLVLLALVILLAVAIFSVYKVPLPSTTNERSRDQFFANDNVNHHKNKKAAGIINNIKTLNSKVKVAAGIIDNQDKNAANLNSQVKDASKIDGLHSRPRPIQLHQFEYSLSPGSLCDAQTQVFVAVVSSPEDTFNRQAIRDTWGSYTRRKRARMRLAFFIGTRPEVNQKLLAAEATTFDDLVVDSSFYDSYHNLTRKVLAAMNWATKNCQQAEFFFKADTRVYVNPQNLVRAMRHYNESRGLTRDFILGRLREGSKPIRDPKNKRFISKEDYPYDKFPDFLDRESYLMRARTAARMVEMVRLVPVPIGSPLEEVYVTGILPLLIDVPLISSEHINLAPSEASLETISCCHVNPKLMKELWEGVPENDLDKL